MINYKFFLDYTFNNKNPFPFLSYTWLFHVAFYIKYIQTVILYSKMCTSLKSFSFTFYYIGSERVRQIAGHFHKSGIIRLSSASPLCHSILQSSYFILRPFSLALKGRPVECFEGYFNFDVGYTDNCLKDSNKITRYCICHFNLKYGER